MIFPSQIIGQSNENDKRRQALLRELNVDAIAFLDVTYDLPQGGFSLGISDKLRLGNGKFTPEVKTRLSLYDKQGYIGYIQSDQDSQGSFEKDKLEKGLVVTFQEGFKKGLIKTKKTL